MAPGGRHVEFLGSWDPHRKSGVFNGEKINYWIGKGAQVSDSVWNILIKQGIVKGKKRAIKISKKTKKLEEGGKPAGAEVKEIKKEEVKKEESKKEEIKAVEIKTEKPEKEEIKKEEKIEEKKPEEAKPEEKK